MMDDRFSDKLPDRYYYTKLPDATQGRGESAEELGGLYSKLCQRAVSKVQDEVQRIINEEVELALYIHGRRVVVGQQIQLQMPCTFGGSNAVSNRSVDS
jgi:hypothetical protein